MKWILVLLPLVVVLATRTEDESIEVNLPEEQSLEEQSLEDESLEDQSADEESTRERSVEDESTDDNLIEDHLIDDQLLEGSVTDPYSIAPKFIEFDTELTQALEPMAIDDEDDLTHLSETIQRAFLEFVETESSNPPIVPQLSVAGESSFDLVLPPKFRAYQSVIFRQSDGRLVKYQANCDPAPRRGIHPLVRDYLFLHALRETGVVPQVYMISAPVEMPYDITLKTDFDMPLADRIKCYDHIGAVRYLVMDDAGYDLMTWLSAHKDKRFSTESAIRILRTLMSYIQTLHANNIVHGDIHMGNIVLSRNTLKLIDFGVARFEDEIITHRPVRTPLKYIHGLYSPNELMGMHGSYRDDVFRALIVAASLMGGFEWVDYCLSFVSDGPAMYEFKQEDFLFDAVGFQAGSDIEDETDRTAVRAYLQNVLDHVRGIHEILEKPDYEFIDSQLVAILTIIEQRKTE